MHVNGVHSAGPIVSSKQILAGAVASTLLSDFFVRAAGVANLYGRVFESLPLPVHSQEIDNIVRNFLRLNCLTSAYAPLWKEITGEDWTESVPLRNPLQRQRTQVRIDVSVGLLLNVSADELCMIYRTQFPVMRKYDLRNYFDAHGRIVPENVIKSIQDKVLVEDAPIRTNLGSGEPYTLNLPIGVFEKEAEIRQMYAEEAKNFKDYENCS